jgi:hypothetical protein
VDPGKLGGFIESVTSDLEAEHVGIPVGAHMTVGDRQVEARQPYQWRDG